MWWCFQQRRYSWKWLTKLKSRPERGKCAYVPQLSSDRAISSRFALDLHQYTTEDELCPNIEAQSVLEFFNEILTKSKGGFSDDRKLDVLSSITSSDKPSWGGIRAVNHIYNQQIFTSKQLIPTLADWFFTWSYHFQSWTFYLKIHWPIF